MNQRPTGQNQDEEPLAAAPLTCCRKSGKRYTRHDGVEVEIAAALALQPAEWPERRWRLETLAHLIRLRARDNDTTLLGRLTFAFLEQAKPVVDRWSRGFGTADSEEIYIEVANTLGDLLMATVPSRVSEYLEIDGATSIKQITLRVTGKDRPKASRFRSADPDDDAGYSPTVERLASNDLDPAAHLLAKAEGLAGGPMRLLNAVTDPRHREAFVLKELNGWPLKDGPPGVPTLCQRYDKSARQIRNWIEKAKEQMRAAHGAET